MKQTPQAGLCFRQDRAEPGRSNGEPDFHEHSATETGNNLAAWLSHESRPGRTFISLIVALIYSPRAPRTEERNASASIGLARKANAPAFKANVRISQSGRTVMIITFVFGDTQYSCFAIESRSGRASRHPRLRLGYGELGHNRETAADHRMSLPRSFLKLAILLENPGWIDRHPRHRPWHLPYGVLA
jgi:hypothetical protein